MKRSRRIAPLLLSLLGSTMLQVGCDLPAAAAAAVGSSATVIQFDLERLNDEGLMGPDDGLRALSYELCVPDLPANVAEVEGLDPTLRCRPGPPGRIGCGEAELLCIGHTHQPTWRSVLEGLAALDFVERIDESFGE